MSDLTKKLLELINESKTVNEISGELNLSNRQIYNILTMIRNKGFEFDKKYYDNGDIIYVPKMNMKKKDIRMGTGIITSPDTTSFTALLISDTHIGNEFERLDLLNRLYDYCIKEGIHTIIHCGDIIDGMFGCDDKTHDNFCDQIDYAIKNYPFDRSILNFAVLGDHDYNSLEKSGQDFAKVLENYRHDIVPLGYGIGRINIKNDIIILRHPFYVSTNVKIYGNYTLVLKGHAHKSIFFITPNAQTTIVYVPALMTFNNDYNLPSAIKMKLNFSNGLISDGIFYQLLVDEKIYTINEFDVSLGYGKNFTANNEIRLEEDRTKKLVLSN